MNRYDKHIEKIRPALRHARKHGAHNSVTIAEHLNLLLGVYAPSGKPWDKNSVLRALRRLKARGFDEGRPPHLARHYV